MKRLKNQGINQSGHSFLSQSISSLGGRTPAPNDLPPSSHSPPMEVDTSNNTHLPSVYLPQTETRASVDAPRNFKTPAVHRSRCAARNLNPSHSFFFNFLLDRLYHNHIPLNPYPQRVNVERSAMKWLRGQRSVGRRCSSLQILGLTFGVRGSEMSGRLPEEC